MTSDRARRLVTVGAVLLFSFVVLWLGVSVFMDSFR
jgi:hypothetical protein